MGWVMRILLVALLFTLAPRVMAEAGPIEWLRDEQAALAKAKSEHRPLMIDFYADWCSSCMELDKRTYTDPRVREVVGSRFVALKVDCTDETAAITAIEKKYGVDALPTVLFLDSQGNPFSSRVTEFVTADAFLTTLASVH